MRTMIFKAVGFVIVLLAARRFWNISHGFGYDRRGYVYRPGKCRDVPPIDTGSEDIALTDGGLAFISSGMRVELCKRFHDDRILNLPGRIYLFDLDRPELDATEVSLPEELRSDFHPHGLSLWEDSDSGDIRLFVVNHRGDGDTVEVLLFDQREVSFRSVKSIRSDLFASLNDVAATGPDTFYAANDGYFTGCWRFAEAVFGLQNSRLVYFDGEKVTTILKGEQELNSVAISKTGREMYLTRPFGQRVDIYNISEDSLSLERTTSIQTGLGIDNVFVDRNSGDLWFGGHPSFYLLGDHFADFDVHTPSQVIRIHPSGPKTDPWEIHKIYSPFGDDGDLISGSSSVVYYKDKMLIGSIFDKAVYCEINQDTVS